MSQMTGVASYRCDCGHVFILVSDDDRPLEDESANVLRFRSSALR